MSAAATHVVLGGNGVAGRETVRALLRRGIEPASVGRSPSSIDGARSITADLLDGAATAAALAGAEVAYLTAGLPYSASVWERDWPPLVTSAVDACLEHGTRLVYLDNVYAFGRVDGPMADRMPLAPVSRKGRVRATALEALEAAADRGLSLTIARSADFYGPGATTSVFNSFVLRAVAAGKRPSWLLDADQPHSLTYTPDLGEALAILGTTASSGRPWNVPTAPAVTGRRAIELATGGEGSFSVMRGSTLRLGALFNRAARETVEMSYQYSAPSVLDSSDFERTFGAAPTPLADGIAATLEAERRER